MIDLVHQSEHQAPVCLWIAQHIEAINAQLTRYLQACHDCFHTWEQPTIQIFAAPLARSFGLDAFCNFQTKPISILIDVGRMKPKNWLLAVVHEYAHAHVGSPGHDQAFARSLTHLCLGLGIVPPQSLSEDRLRCYPNYLPTPNSLAFWRGETEDWRLSVTNSYFSSESLS